MTLDEPESEAVRSLAESRGQVRCAVNGQIEVAAVFHLISAMSSAARPFRLKGMSVVPASRLLARQRWFEGVP